MGVLPVIDEATARAFLASHRSADPGAVTLVGAGEWSRCFAFTDGDVERVVRFGRRRDDFEKDRWAVRFATEWLPVPVVVEIGAAFDGWFAISDRAHGTDLEALDTAGWRRVLPALLAGLDALREADCSPTVGYGVWDAAGRAPHAHWRAFLRSVVDDPVGHRTHGWSQRLAASAVGDATFRRGVDALHEVADAYAGPRHLVHADLINRNVLVDDDRITAFLDWGCSLLGDPLFDVAWLEVWAPWHEGLSEIDVRGEVVAHLGARGTAEPDLDARMRACSLRILLDTLGFCAFVGRTDDLLAIDAQLAALLE